MTQLRQAVPRIRGRIRLSGMSEVSGIDVPVDIIRDIENVLRLVNFRGNRQHGHRQDPGGNQAENQEPERE